MPGMACAAVMAAAARTAAESELNLPVGIMRPFVILSVWPAGSGSAGISRIIVSADAASVPYAVQFAKVSRCFFGLRERMCGPMFPLDPFMTETTFSRTLVEWQRSCGRRTLPWQAFDTPYERLVSEVMLQQTQVAVVKDYFARFMAAFPTVQILAAADDEAVMKLWAGLGYYSRARNLLACARVVVRDFGGVFPKDVETLATLPGIGKSTASAVASFSYGTVAPVVDGNVKRVLTRLFTVTSPPSSTGVIQGKKLRPLPLLLFVMNLFMHAPP